MKYLPLLCALLSASDVLAPHKLDQAYGLENLHELRPWLYVGGEPRGGDAFDKLESLGVKTIISVDGARPDLAEAKAHGQRYIHIPMGYGGIPPGAAASLAEAVKTAERPVYIHCHHGKHRGPAMAALGLRIEEGLDAEAAAALMRLVGTAASYTGLYRDVAAFTPETIAGQKVVLYETVPVLGFAGQMAQIDRIFARLERFSKNGFAPLPDHPDLSAEHEALMLLEELKESHRAVTPRAVAEFVAMYDESLAAAEELHTLAAKDEKLLAGTAFKRLSASCKDCHAAYRDSAAGWERAEP